LNAVPVIPETGCTGPTGRDALWQLTLGGPPGRDDGRMTAGEIIETDRGWKDRHAKELFEYERLMQRVLAQNALVWQTPSLGLAAQAFVLTTSLNGRTPFLVAWPVSSGSCSL
jgi:hypothetical protein